METVFISGADKGLGLSLVRQFLRAGFHVFAGLYEPPWPASSDMQQAFPDTLTGVALDVAKMDSIHQAVQRVAEHTSALDILINNAGVHLESQRTPLEDLDLADGHLERTLAVNALGPLRLTQQFYPLLCQGSRKLLLNISSEAGSIGACGRDREFAYCMSKAALNMQAKLLQNYLGPQGFKVLAIHPGWMRTDMGGREADITPEQAADGIFALALRCWQTSDPIYLDYQGQALNW